MLLLVNSKLKVVGFLAVVVVLLLFSLNRFDSLLYIQAQENETRDTKTLLDELDTRSKQELGFSIGFKFAIPLGEGEAYLSVPDSNEEFDRWIGEIGADFICFYEVAGGAEIVRCTPFSNIVAITYLNNP